MEGLPCTIFNIMFVVYGCFSAETGEEEEGGGNGKNAVFLILTFFSVALGVKKFLEWRGVKEDKKDVESWKESVEHRLVDANMLFDEIEGVEETGEEGLREENSRLREENARLRERMREWQVEEGNEDVRIVEEVV